MASLALDRAEWEVEVAEVRPRDAASRGGHTEDSVILVRRRL